MYFLCSIVSNDKGDAPKNPKLSSLYNDVEARQFGLVSITLDRKRFPGKVYGVVWRGVKGGKIHYVPQVCTYVPMYVP